MLVGIQNHWKEEQVLGGASRNNPQPPESHCFFCRGKSAAAITGSWGPLSTHLLGYIPARNTHDSLLILLNLNSKSHIQEADWQNINWRLAERNSGKCSSSYSNFCNRWWHTRRKFQWMLTEPIHSNYHKDMAMREREPGTSCQVGACWVSERNGGKRNDHEHSEPWKHHAKWRKPL